MRTGQSKSKNEGQKKCTCMISMDPSETERVMLLSERKNEIKIKVDVHTDATLLSHISIEF